MSGRTGSGETPDPPISTEPDPSNNEEVLDRRLDKLRDQYSYDRLSDLSARRLGAIDQDDEGYSELDFLRQDFRALRERFPDENCDQSLRMLALGDDYEGLAPLTREQRQRIRDCQRKCSRNLDRARQEALEREDLAGPLSKFAAWLTNFADAATPVVGSVR